MTLQYDWKRSGTAHGMNELVPRAWHRAMARISIGTGRKSGCEGLQGFYFVSLVEIPGRLESSYVRSLCDERVLLLLILKLFITGSIIQAF